MSEMDKNRNPRVNDRRRFDAQGNPLPQDADVPASAAPAEPAENAQAEVTQQGQEAGPRPEAPPGAEAGPEGAELTRLTQDLAQARKRVDELARAFQSMNADREEFKARLTRERERMIDVERGNVAVTLLEAIDELDRALSAATEDTSALAKGVRLIRDSLLKKLLSTGIERVEVLGRPYDPNLAEAGDMEITDNPDEDQHVTAEIRAGYKLKDRVIRPARVKVAKYVKPAQA